MSIIDNTVRNKSKLKIKIDKEVINSGKNSLLNSTTN